METTKRLATCDRIKESLEYISHCERQIVEDEEMIIRYDRVNMIGMVDSHNKHIKLMKRRISGNNRLITKLKENL